MFLLTAKLWNTPKKSKPPFSGTETTPPRVRSVEMPCSSLTV